MAARTKTKIIYRPEYAPDQVRELSAVVKLLSLPPSNSIPFPPYKTQGVGGDAANKSSEHRSVEGQQAAK